jgi:hypothetical protein
VCPHRTRVTGKVKNSLQIGHESLSWNEASFCRHKEPRDEKSTQSSSLSRSEDVFLFFFIIIIIRSSSCFLSSALRGGGGGAFFLLKDASD